MEVLTVVKGQTKICVLTLLFWVVLAVVFLMRGVNGVLSQVQRVLLVQYLVGEGLELVRIIVVVLHIQFVTLSLAVLHRVLLHIVGHRQMVAEVIVHVVSVIGPGLIRRLIVRGWMSLGLELIAEVRRITMGPWWRR
ncbi:TPA: hypothetical protein DD455_05065 [Candidatus Shapirobacteria bacterium]|nr:hypothetical protein [Candidatus Shapirobacteria bacterium]